jgi:WD40 repeat protein
MDEENGIKPESGTIYLWNARTLRPLKSFAPVRGKSSHGTTIGFWLKGLALSPDGKRMGVSRRGKSGFAVYEIQSQKQLWRNPADAPFAQFTADGRFVALSHWDSFELCEAKTGKVAARWKAASGSPIGVFCLSPDGKTMAWIGAEKKRPAITDRETPRPPDGKAIEIRRVSDGKILRTLPDSQETESVAFSPDGTQIVSLALGDLNSNAIDGSIIRSHSVTGKLNWKRDYRVSKVGRKKNIFCDAIFSPNGAMVAALSTSTGKNNILIDAVSGRQKQELKFVRGQTINRLAPPGLAFSPSGKQLYALGQSDVLVWGLKAPK